MLERFETHVEGSVPDELADYRLINHPVARSRLAVWPPIELLSIVVPPTVSPDGADQFEATSVDAHNAGGVTVLDIVDAVVRGTAADIPDWCV